jgi:hypothetical protein
MKEKLQLVLLSLGAALPLAHGAIADSNVLRPDLAFHFVCKDKDRSALENEIGNFLREQGFKVLNQGRIQREHGVFLTDLRIVGLDDKRRTIRFEALHAEGRYSAALNTPPPTERAPELEGTLTDFASKGLGCELRQVNRGTNAADAAKLHGYKIRQLENLFHQAERLRGEHRI